MPWSSTLEPALEAMMNRHQLFHEIATRADLSSMGSILRVTLARLIATTGATRGVWFATGAGGLRTLAALTAAGAEFVQPMRHVHSESLQRAITSARAVQGEFPLGGERARFLAVPALADDRVDGAVWLERRFNQANLAHADCLPLMELLADVLILLHRSRDYERQNFEIDAIRSKMEMTELQLVSAHPSMLHLFGLIRKLARVPSTVLIHGESGTGKELVARSIYQLGRYSGPFISMNCGAIEPNLLKSELFGYVKGSFTGAQRDRAGLFKKAENGILFMDEIGEMPSDMQVSLLRTLESGEILPVGADAPEVVNTRILAATHQDLRERVKEGTFRNDLYQRLKGLVLEVPPLRRRKEDIPLLAEFFRKKYNGRLGTDFAGFTAEAMRLLTEGDYRAGNVRELEHMIERAMVFEDRTDAIGAEHLQLEDDPAQPKALAELDLGDSSFETLMNQYAAQVLGETIKQCNGNKTKAMKKLGLSRSTFYGMLNRYGGEGS